MFRFRTLLILSLSCFALPAAAENPGSPFKGGMRYTSVHKRAAGDKIQKIATPTKTSDSAEEKETTESKIWERYKNLAAGEAKDAPEANKLPKTPDAPEKTADTTSSKTPTGLAGILQQYQRNKDQRKEMKTITISRPKKPEKPAVLGPKSTE